MLQDVNETYQLQGEHKGQGALYLSLSRRVLCFRFFCFWRAKSSLMGHDGEIPIILYYA